MITRLEPIIFVIIGYYFGRLPAQQNEKTLKDEIGRQTQKADAAQHAKEQAQQTREALEEKIKNVSAALTSAGPSHLDSKVCGRHSQTRWTDQGGWLALLDRSSAADFEFVT